MITTSEYRQLELNKLELDGDYRKSNTNDYYKSGIKIFDYKGNSTNQLTITNKELKKIKKILTEINY